MTERTVPRIFSKRRRVARALRAAVRQRTSDPATFLVDDMFEDILERLDFTRAEPGAALVLGDVTGALADGLRDRGFEAQPRTIGEMDEEQPFPGRYRYVFSLNTLDTLNDLPGALVHIRNALDPEGLFIGQCMGAGTLPALRKIMLAADGERPHARIHPQIDRPAASGLMSRAGFAKQVVDSHTLTVRYREFDTLIADLRDQGLASVLADAPPPITRAGLDRIRAAYDALREDDGKVSETFEILTLTGWR